MLGRRRARRGGAPHGRNAGRAERGFTLLEIVVALGILSTGLLAIAAGQLAALRISTRSRYLSQAAHLAQAQIEAFQAMPLASLPGSGNDPNGPIDVDVNDLDMTTFNRRWTIEPNTPVAGVTRITVSVDWFDPKLNQQRTATLQTMKGL